MSGSQPERGRDRQQRMPSGPRPSPGSAITAASSSKSHDTFVTAPSRGRTVETAREEAFKRLGGLTESPTIYDDPESFDSPDAEGSGQEPYLPSAPQTRSPEMFSASPAATAKSPRSKPTTLRLNTLNLLAPSTSPKKPVSPGLQHWQQVRDHVMTPAEERAAHSLARNAVNDKEKDKKKFGLVSKAAGKFGIKQAADNVMKGDEKRKNTMAMTAEFGSLTAEQREEITRERRRFARDVKACRDACSAEDTRRRLLRLGKGKAKATDRNDGSVGQRSEKGHSAPLHGMQDKRPAYENDFYAFAPLLTELHRHMPAARGKKPWSRTCPHHAAILAELATAFLDDGVSTDGERQQALEVFGTVVRNWSSDSPEEELARWTWLSHILLWEDRQLRERGLGLLESMLRPESITQSEVRPDSAHSFQSLATSLLRLLHAVETSPDRQDRHIDIVGRLLASLGDGNIIEPRLSTVVDLIGNQEEVGSTGGITRELIWTALGIAASSSPEMADWLFRHRAANARVSKLKQESKLS
jgi:hypothetical protein